MFVIPIEVLSPRGIDRGFCDQLTQRLDIDQGWFEFFNRAYAMYWKRAASLHRSAPAYWFPPRPQHIAIATGTEHVRPYFQPFHQNTWLMYLNDFDRQHVSIELSVFLFFQAERMGLMGAIVPALHANLPYFLTLSATERKDFMRGCKLTDRPDAKGYQALGAAQSWLKSLFHETFRPPRVAIPGMRIQKENGLIVPPAQASQLDALQQSWMSAAEGVFADYQARAGGPAGHCVDELLDWLTDNRPQALITGKDGEILWHPEQAGQHEKLRPALAGLTRQGDQRIRKDLDVVDRHSSAFLASLKNPEALVRPAPYMTEGGLSYIHPEHRLIAYDIGPGRNEKPAVGAFTAV